MRKSYSNVYCDIKVYNTMYHQEVYHRRVPIYDVEWIAIAPHLKVRVIKKYKIDRGYYRGNNEKRNTGFKKRNNKD